MRIMHIAVLKLLKLILLFIILLFVCSLLIYLLPNYNVLSDFSHGILAVHNINKIAQVNVLQKLVFYLISGGESVLIFLDNNIPLFPSQLRLIWWTPEVISILTIIPLIGLLVFLLSRELKGGGLAFLIVIFWLISFPTIVSDRWDYLVSTNHYDFGFPWLPKYVWMSDGINSKSEYVQYKYEWKQREVPSHATIQLSCLGHYRLSVNDKAVYHGPVFGVIPVVYVDSLDISTYIRRGNNTIDVSCIFINGITHEYNAYSNNGVLVGGRIADGIFSHNLADNRLWHVSHLVSVTPTKRLFDAGYSEQYDLTKKDMFSSIPVKIKAEYNISPRPVSYLSSKEILVKKITPNTFDLTKFSTGYLQLTSNQNESCSLDITYGVNLDGGNNPNIYMGQIDSIRLPKGRTSWEHISRRSGKYIGLKGNCDMTKLSLRFVQTQQNLAFPTSRHDLSSLDQSIISLVKNSLVNNIQDHIEDSVDRERATYLGDAVQVSRCLLSARGNEAIVRLSIEQFAHSQKKDGSFPSMTPSGLDQFIPSYSLQWPELVNLYYSHTLDNRFLNEQFPRIKKMIQWTENNTSSKGFFYNKHNYKSWWNYYDWTPTSSTYSYAAQNQLWLIHDYLIAAKYAQIVGEDSAIYRNHAEILKKQLYKYAYDKDKNIFYDSFDEEHRDGISLVTNSLAGNLELFPTLDDSRTALAYFQNDYTTDSPFSESRVVDWMIKMGEKDLALKTIRNYWGGMINDGATSVFEVYKPGKLLPDESNQSYSHAWGCAPLYQYSQLIR